MCFDQTDEVYIWGLIPTLKGMVLIGGNDYDYSVYVNGTIFLNHIYGIYETDGYLVITRDGRTYQVNVEQLLNSYNITSDNGRRLLKNDKSTVVSGGGISISGIREDCNSDAIELSSTLLKEFEPYLETTMEELFCRSDIGAEQSVPPEKTTSTNLYVEDDAPGTDSFAVVKRDGDKLIHDEEWSDSRALYLKSYLQFLTKSTTLSNTRQDAMIRMRILMNARAMMEINWKMQGQNPLHNEWPGYVIEFEPGQKYYGLPYQQGPDYTYAGHALTLKQFKKLADDSDSDFYTEKTFKKKTSQKYGTDCSGFVSYAIDANEKKGTWKLQDSNEQNLVLLLSSKKNNGNEILSMVQQGDFLVWGGAHCKLIAGVYLKNKEVRAVATLESRTWTTSSRRNIHLYGDYEDIREWITECGYGNSDLQNWIHYVLTNESGLTESLEDLVTEIEEGGSENDKHGYNLFQPKNWNTIEHHHDCGITVSYDGICADDLCCSASGTENCYYKNHGVLLNGAHHWDGGDPTNTSCVFCGEAIHHTYGSKESINDEKHRMYCLVCNKAINENHTFDYTYLKPKYHTVYCTDGCGFSKTEPHTIIPGTNSCACGYSICNHRYIYVIMKASGHAQRCTICGDEHETVPHNYEARQTNGAIVCSVPGAAGLLGAGTTAITDSNAGTTMGHILVCKECGYEKEGIFPHTYTLTEIIPGNSSEHRMKCECGIYVDIPHSFMIEDAVKQGCRKYCSNCGYEEYLDHNYTAYTTTKIATCTEPGQKQRTCKVCGHVRIKEIPATGHDYSKTERKEPLCKENGYERIVCTKCGDIRSETVLPYPGHDYESPVVISKATCTEPGHRTKRCKVCGFVKEYEYPQAKGHNYETKTVAATCTADGYTREVCSRCGDIRSETILTKTGHSFGEYVVTKEPTCTTKGVKTRTCSRCGQTSTKKISETGHSYGAFSVTTPASCTSTGTKSRTCSKCGHVDTEAIPMTAHKYNKKGKCKVCGAQK